MKPLIEKKAKFWDDTFFRFDIAVIDDQHQKLFSLFDSIAAINENHDIALLSVAVEELNNYSMLHFKSEEDLMRHAKVRNIDDHIAQHIIFLDQINEFRTMLASQNFALRNVMIIFLRKWLLNHIGEIDKLYTAQIRLYLNQPDT